MTPNNKDPNQPKKPAQPPTGKNPADGAAKPTAPKPAAPKPGQKPASKPTEKKPAAKAQPERSWATADGGTRKIGQILVDLGFLDESQLWDILEEARNNGVRVGQVALSRGLINEDQLLQAVAEQHNLKVVNLEEQKPNQQAVSMV